MVSRSTVFALVFAFIATASLAVVASVTGGSPAAATPTPQAMPIYELPRVVISGRVDRNAAAEPAQNGN